MNPTNTEDPNKEDESRPVPPGSPEKAPVKDPDESSPMGDPQSPDKKKPRL